MNHEELSKVVTIMLDVMPRNITDKEIAIIMINFIIQKRRASHWPIINDEIEAGLFEYLILQVENEVTEQIEIKAVKDANDFMGRIVNDFRTS